MRAAAILGLLALPAIAQAHLDMLDPPSRYGRGDLKDGPCGLAGGEAEAITARYAPGETIELRIDEYVDHPSHYRVALDMSGTDANLDDPICLDNCDDSRQDAPTFEEPDHVMVLGIFEDEASEEQVLRVTLPNAECEHCVLQVMQIMYDKRPYTIGGNDNYYRCSDIAIEGELVPEDMGVSPLDAGVEMGVGDDAGTAPIEDAGAIDSGASDARAMDPRDGGAPDLGSSALDGGCSLAPAGASPLLLFLAVFALRRRRA
ncbi:MAG: SCE4755 family polysaccharide monooxygenase-like protein [Myxococcota bacterium]